MARRARALAVIEGYLASGPAIVSGLATWALARLGQPARALAVAQDHQTTNDTLLLFCIVWSPQGRAIRQLPEFAEFARKTGLKALWDRYGPPDGCHRNATGDYIHE